ncbi:MAG: GyrI-like domain-containing protein [Rufibacter sp.]
MTKKFLIYMAVVFGLILIGYTYLGGFAEVKVTKVASPQLFIAGQYFEGKTDAEALGQLYQRVGQAVEKKELVGDLAGIYYNNPSKESKTVKAFIGVSMADTTVALPQGFEVRVVPAGKAMLQGELEASMLLAPRRIYSALFDYAEENKLKMQEFYVERFPEGKPAVILVGLQEK